MMVLQLVAALGKVDRNLQDAARMPGANTPSAFVRVTFPSTCRACCGASRTSLR